MELIYLLHYEARYPNGRQPQHYIGHTTKMRFGTRMREHRSGSNKARLTQVLAEAKIPFLVAQTWEGSYDLERQLKRRHNHKQLCPICKEE